MRWTDAALELMRLLRERGVGAMEPRALAALGACLFEGLGVPADWVEAARLLGLAALAGEPVGQARLAHVLFWGFGVVQDAQASQGWAEKAVAALLPLCEHRAAKDRDAPAGSGGGSGKIDVEVLYVLGRCFYHGLGAEKSAERAFALFRQAAEAGYPPSQRMLGRFHEIGIIEAANREEARKWFRLAAEQGHAASMVSLAVIDRDACDDYVRHLAAAAQLRHPIALQHLAYAYDYGEGVAKDKTQSLLLYEAAARSMEPFSRGVLLQDWKWDGPASAYARGVRLELGVGVGAPNREGAALCFLEASRGGFPLSSDSARSTRATLIGWALRGTRARAGCDSALFRSLASSPLYDRNIWRVIGALLI